MAADHLLRLTIPHVGALCRLGSPIARYRHLITRCATVIILFCLPIQGQNCMSCPYETCNTLEECDFGGVPKDYCKYDGGCPNNYLPGVSCCCWNTPIIVDVDGSGFQLTNPERGVLFDLVGNGILSKVAWTEPGSTNAWLTLDRNGNGRIDNISELFGNRTEQPKPPSGQRKNGFLALGVFDSPEMGGDGDGAITEADEIYSKLRLWQDLNHNGVSEPDELQPLASLGLKSISLNYREARKIDEFGNHFALRSHALFEGNKTRWAWDVVLRSLQLESSTNTTFVSGGSNGVAGKTWRDVEDVKK